MSMIALLVFLVWDNPTVIELPAEVQKNIDLRIEYGQFPSIAIGIITREGTSTYAAGSLPGEREPDALTIYEIGSISKTFTCLILAAEVEAGRISLSDPVQKLMPEGLAMPKLDGQSIQFQHIATHSSSLPRMPDNFTPADPANPYVDYSEQQMFDFVTGYTLTRPIGSQYEYSNLAMGLLGHLLAKSHNTTYEQLVHDVVLKPLNMDLTGITLTPEMRAHLAPPTSQGREVSNWDLIVMAGAGALRSNVRDMSRYLSAQMGIQQSDLHSAMKMTQKQQYQAPSGTRVGLGWHLVDSTVDIVAHSGGTGGYRTFAGFLADGSKGVVVLTNSTTGADDIGYHLLDASKPLTVPKKSIGTELRAIIDSKDVETAIARYHELKKNDPTDIDFSEPQLNNLGYQFMAEGKLEKAIAILALNVEVYPQGFNTYDSLGEAYMNHGEKELAIANYKKSLELNPGNDNARMQLAKLGEEAPAVEDVSVSAEILAEYVGKYEVFPGFIIEVTVEGSNLFAQATAQDRFQVFPQSQTKFYYKVVNAQLEFVRNDEGRVDAMILHQNGSHKGPRVE